MLTCSYEIVYYLSVDIVWLSSDQSQKSPWSGIRTQPMLKVQEHLQYWSSPGPVGLLHAALVQGKSVVLLLVQ